MSTVRHSFVSPKTDPADTTLVRPSDWNADHEEGVAVFGAAGDGVTDDTSAIQAAINAASTGGIVYLPSGSYLVSSTLSLGANSRGVRLLGEADGFGGESPNSGTYIKWTGTGPCISVPGCYGFEVAYLNIWGNNAGVNGIEITNDGSTHVARSGSIHDVSMYQLTGVSILCTDYSYVSIRDISANSGAHGLLVPETTAILREFLRAERMTAHSMTTAGFEVRTGSYSDFRSLNAAHCGVGIKLNAITAAGLYNHFLDSVVVDHSTTYGIEIDAAAGYLTRIMLRGINVYMNGTSAGEKAVYIHRTGGYNATVHIDYLNIDIEGATPPTTSIDLTGAYQGSVSRVRDVSGGVRTDGTLVVWEPTIGSAAPVSGTYFVGERVYNTAPASGQPIGWVCTVAGSPGTWKAFGTIA